MTVNDPQHCSHCPGPDDPRHNEPRFAKAEADCAFYENPGNRVAAGPAVRRTKRNNSPDAARHAAENDTP